MPDETFTRWAIAIEGQARRAARSYLDTLDVFDRPHLGHPMLRRLEQRAREAEWRQDAAGVVDCWARWVEELQRLGTKAA